MTILFEPVIAIGSDTALLGLLSLAFGRPGHYFPVLEAPREGRPDLTSHELIERSNILSILKPRQVLIVGLDRFHEDVLTKALSGLAATTVLRTEADVVDYMIDEGLVSGDPSGPQGNPYAELLLRPYAMPPRLETMGSKAASTAPHSISRGLVCTEPDEGLMPLVAANYAWAHGHAFRVLNPVPTLTLAWTEDTLNKIDQELTSSRRPVPSEHLLKQQLRQAIDVALEWPKNVNLCFFTRSGPYGLLFPDNPTCHVLKLEAGVSTALSLGWTAHEATQPPKPCLTSVFVDPQWPDIYSETNDVIKGISHAPLWVEQLTGPRATCRTVEMYLHFFPYDLLYVSSHGKAPSYRWNRYSFHDSSGMQHEIETYEFEYFAPQGENVLVTQKTYPLKVDGVLWSDKEGLTRIGGGELLRQFVEQTKSDPDDKRRLEFKWVTNTHVEGIALVDGVFFGPVVYLAGMGHPVVVLNCCAMWASLGVQIMHGRARACVATLWSVADRGAVEFGVALATEILNKPIVEAVKLAKDRIQEPSHRDPYVCFGWPHSRTPHIGPSVAISSQAFVARQITKSMTVLLESLPSDPNARRNAMNACKFLATRLTEMLIEGADVFGDLRKEAGDTLSRLRAEREKGDT